MNPIKQIIALAEWDGFSPPLDLEYWNYSNQYSPTGISIDQNGQCKRWIEKKHLTSLDAIMPLVRKLDTLGEWNSYVSWLSLIVLGKSESWKTQQEHFGTKAQFSLFTATPPQISEALLRTIDKWEED